MSEPKSIVTKSPSRTTASPGTPWGLLVLGPVIVMGSKLLPSPPSRIMR